MTVSNAYVEGFIQKCAEVGVDPEELVKLAAEENAPNYEPATGEEECGNCEYWSNGTCTLYNFDANAKYTCDSWEEE